MAGEATGNMPDEGGAVTDPSAPAAPGTVVHRPLSAVLRDLPGDERMPLGDLMACMGSRAHGTALLLLSLPEAIPLPIPSASTFLGGPLAIISAHLAVLGEGSRLPRRVQRWPVPAALLALLRDRVAPGLERVERLSHPRWEDVAGREHLIGLACLWLSLILLLPLPFVNTPPALCIALLAWGMIQRDGAFVIAGIAGGVALTATLAAAAAWLVSRM